MSSPQAGIGRFRAYLQFVAAVLYFFLARSIADRSAAGLVTDEWHPLATQAILVFLLLLGYATMGKMLERQHHAVAAQGLPLRQGLTREIGMGLAFGWGLAVVCVLPLALKGGIAVVLHLGASAWGWLPVEIAFFALLALAEEVAFRSYAFQCFVSAVGPITAAIGFAAYYAIVQILFRGGNHASIAVSLVFSLLLSSAYLRTQALWLSWGLNFGWKASCALIFGLTVSGMNNHSPVVEGDPMGPFWLTGGGYGLDGSWWTFVVMLAALPLLFKFTRELSFRYNVPVFHPGGIAVDLDAAARRQHDAAMGSVEPAAASLIQIQGATLQAMSQPLPPAGQSLHGEPNGTP